MLIRMYRFAFVLTIFCSSMLFFTRCGSEKADETIRSILQGRIMVSAEVDSTVDYRDFEIVVGQGSEDGLDTLGYAVTDSLGNFGMEITAPARGIYPILISRRGAVLKMDEIVLADQDTTILSATFPMGNRPLRLRSQENSAMTAYRNTMALHNQSLVELMQEGNYTDEALTGVYGRTATILWSMRDNYANTIGAELGAAQSVQLLSGWADSLLIERARTFDIDHSGYVEVARAARQAQTRLQGPEAGIEMLRSFIEPVTDPDKRAALQAELVAAYMEDNQAEEARQAAHEITETYPDTPWADWAERAVYDFENLMPGMQAPDFQITAWNGESVHLDSLKGMIVLLEFYRPEDPTYQQELELRNALYQLSNRFPFTIISISMQPDPEINEAFFEGRNFPGIAAVAPVAPPEGDDVVSKYNVHVVPRRFLIDSRGEIYGRYDGGALGAVQDDLAGLLAELRQPS